MGVWLISVKDIIDVFVIGEANTTQTGAPKRLHFWENRYRYQQWWPKIKHLVLWEGTLHAVAPHLPEDAHVLQGTIPRSRRATGTTRTWVPAS